MLKPWTTPDELFHRVVSEFLQEWRRATEGRLELTVVADRWSSRGYEIRNLLAREPSSPCLLHERPDEAHDLLQTCGFSVTDKPAVVPPDDTVLHDPSDEELAKHGYQVRTEIEDPGEFDVVIVGAGAGGAGGSRLRLIRGSARARRRPCVDRRSGEVERTDPQLPGLQRGLTGRELATRAYQQAWIFGTEFLLMRSACGLRATERGHVVTIDDSEIEAKSVLLAMGCRTGGSASTHSSNSRAPACSTARRLQTHSSSRAAACSSSAAPTRQGRLPCTRRYAAQVTVVYRGRSSAGMSQYLLDEIEAQGNISVKCSTQVVGGGGDGRLEELVLDGPERAGTVAADALFILIGAEPNTSWLPPEIGVDERGFVLTGAGEHMFETSVPVCSPSVTSAGLGQEGRFSRGRRIGRDPAGASLPRRAARVGADVS